MFGAFHNMERGVNRQCTYCHGYLIQPPGPKEGGGFRTILA